MADEHSPIARVLSPSCLLSEATSLPLGVAPSHLWYDPLARVQDIFLGRNRTIGACIEVAVRHRHPSCEFMATRAHGQSEVMMPLPERATVGRQRLPSSVASHHPCAGGRPSEAH